MAEKPLLTAAFLCEKVLTEKDDVLTAVRIVDTFFISIPPNLPAEGKAAIQLSGLLSFKKASPGAEAEKHQVTITLRLPSGQTLPPFTMDFIFKPDELTGANLILNLNLPVEEFGLYRFDVSVDGSAMTRIPFRLLEKPTTPTPTIH